MPKVKVCCDSFMTQEMLLTKHLFHIFLFGAFGVLVLVFCLAIKAQRRLHNYFRTFQIKINCLCWQKEQNDVRFAEHSKEDESFLPFCCSCLHFYCEGHVTNLQIACCSDFQFIRFFCATERNYKMIDDIELTVLCLNTQIKRVFRNVIYNAY